MRGADGLQRFSPDSLRRFRDLRQSMWLQPFFLALAGVALGVTLPWVDRWSGLGAPLSRGLSADAARTLVSAGAAAIAALLAVGFSIATVTVQLAATQYTPRLLRRFMKDGATKHVLGLFTATLTYLLVVLHGIQDQGPGRSEFVPHGAVVFGVLLALLCVALLPYFLHHVTRSIQVETVVTGIAKEAAQTVSELELDGAVVDGPPIRPAVVVPATRAGYLQVFEPLELAEVLPRGCERARVDVAVGDFVLPEAPLVSLWPAVAVDDACARRIEAAFSFSRERNLPQDVLFGVRQLVDMALRALSPGVNDVTTAVMALNELGALTVALVRDGVPATANWRIAHESRPQLVVRTLSLERFVRAAFDEVLLAGREQPRVLARVLEILEHAATIARGRASLSVLGRAAARVHEVAEQSRVPAAWLDSLDRSRARRRRAPADGASNAPTQ